MTAMTATAAASCCFSNNTCTSASEHQHVADTFALHTSRSQRRRRRRTSCSYSRLVNSDDDSAQAAAASTRVPRFQLSLSEDSRTTTSQAASSSPFDRERRCQQQHCAPRQQEWRLRFQRSSTSSASATPTLQHRHPSSSLSRCILAPAAATFSVSTKKSNSSVILNVSNNATCATGQAPSVRSSIHSAAANMRRTCWQQLADTD